MHLNSCSKPGFHLPLRLLSHTLLCFGLVPYFLSFPFVTTIIFLIYDLFFSIFLPPFIPSLHTVSFSSVFNGPKLDSCNNPDPSTFTLQALAPTAVLN
jgi:hypothetical protein